MYKLILFISFSLLCINTWATPKVSKAVLSDKGIEITGSNFGADNPMVFWDDAKKTFESSEVGFGESVTNSETSRWKQNGTKWSKPVTFTDAMPSKSGRKDIAYYGEGHRPFLGSPETRQTKNLLKHMYVSWWYRPSVSPSDLGGSNKFIRIWDNGNGYGTRISWTQMHFTCESDENRVTWGAWTGNVGEWNHHAIWVDLDAGKVKTWVNGKLVHDAPCKKHPDYQDTPLYLGLIGFDHNLTNYQNMRTGLDDIYIGDSLARVEISNSPKWSPTMTKEILPIASWSDGKISTIPHDGKIKLSKDAFIYVVDSKGLVNESGVQVTCTTCPKAKF